MRKAPHSYKSSFSAKLHASSKETAKLTTKWYNLAIERDLVLNEADQHWNKSNEYEGQEHRLSFKCKNNVLASFSTSQKY